MRTQYYFNIALLTVGFILSPLSWWNDLIINVPLAYLLSYPFALIHESFFLPSFILAYWFTNLIGLLMLHWGGETIILKTDNRINILRSIAISIIYTVILTLLVIAGWLDPPTDYL